MTIKAILTDIEGTTSSISFVKDVLFPYAYDSMEYFLSQNFEDEKVKSHILAVCQQENLTECNPENLTQILRQWIQEDRKVTALKDIQGIIWENGFRNGDFKAHLYEDAWEKLGQWHDAKLPIYVYSSGSVYAQKLFFSHSCYGNLLNLFSGFFDTNMGSKKEANSYQAIAESIGLPCNEILFLSDVEAELNAASGVGMETIWFIREEDLPVNPSHKVVKSFFDVNF